MNSSIENFKKSKNFSVSLWVTVKLVISCFLMYYFEYGIYIVIGYILFSIENTGFYHILNNKEADIHFNSLYAKKASIEDIDNLQKQIDNIKEQILEKEYE